MTEEDYTKQVGMISSPSIKDEPKSYLEDLPKAPAMSIHDFRELDTFKARQEAQGLMLSINPKPIQINTQAELYKQLMDVNAMPECRDPVYCDTPCDYMRAHRYHINTACEDLEETDLYQVNIVPFTLNELADTILAHELIHAGVRYRRIIDVSAYSDNTKWYIRSDTVNNTMYIVRRSEPITDGRGGVTWIVYDEIYESEAEADKFADKLVDQLNNEDMDFELPEDDDL